MKISAKSRYGLASIIYMAQQYNTGGHITVLSISENLGISKIYLEQVFSLLKRAELVSSVKGSQGGYQLAYPPAEISVFDVLKSIETGFFDETPSSVDDASNPIEKAMRNLIWTNLDITVQSFLSGISLQDLVTEVQNCSNPDNLMFYI
ncbi:MAG: RrF2 family transcriptional regulator [Saccharofermentanales bacterium]